MTGVPLGPRMVRSDVAPGERRRGARSTCSSRTTAPRSTPTPSPTGRLIGAVLDHTGKPVTGADVSVRPGRESRRHRPRDGDRTIRSFTFPGSSPAAITCRWVASARPPTATRTSACSILASSIGRPRRSSPSATDTVRLPATRLQPPVALSPIVAEIVCRDGTIPASAFLSAEQLPIAADRYGHKDFGSMASSDGRFTIRVVAGHRYLVRGEITVKEPMLDGGFGTYQLATRPVDVDPAAPPPRLVLRSELEKCAEPGGVTVPPSLTAAPPVPFRTDGRRSSRYAALDMKRLLIAAAIALMPLTAAAQATYRPPPPVEQALLALEQRWVTAGKASDGAAVGALLAETFVAIDADGSMRTKAELVERTDQGQVDLRDPHRHEGRHARQQHRHRDRRVGRRRHRRRRQGRRRAGALGRHLVKDDGKWRCVASASAPLATAAALATARRIRSRGIQPAIGDDHPSLAGRRSSSRSGRRRR